MSPDRPCPGCALSLPRDPAAVYTGYYNTSPECWSVYTEVLGDDWAIHHGRIAQLVDEHVGSGISSAQ